MQQPNHQIFNPRTMAQGIRLGDVQWDSDGQTLVWLEGRSAQGVLVAQRRGLAPNDLTTDLSVRARVGYGGGDFTVAHGHVVFVADSRLWRQPLNGGSAIAITPAFGECAAPAVSPDGRWVVFVHSHEGADCVAVVDVQGKCWPQRLITGDDFYMQPVWSASSQQLACVAWNKPQMPWDGSELRLCELVVNAEGLPQLAAMQTLAGTADTAVFQPAFSPDGRWLAYVSDADGWAHVQLYDLQNKVHKQLTFGECEFAQPAWAQGMRTIAWRHDSRAIFGLRNAAARVAVWEIPLEGTPAAFAPMAAYTDVEGLAAAPTDAALACVASASSIPLRVVLCLPPQPAAVVRRSRSETLLPEQLAAAEPISWQSAGGQLTHGLYYAPVGSALGTPPPAVVISHGGPTSQRRMGFHGDVQFLAARGYAVLLLNYRGSTGYGRAYMLQLRGAWGKVDREDAVSGAQHLAQRGLADAARMVVMGGSAGGTTVLMALALHPGVFRVGVNFYGVSDMFGLDEETHKFEAHYNATMLGALPQAAAVYRERSAVFFADNIVDPLIVFQGSDDNVVKQNQSDRIVESLRRRNVRHEYHVYQGEGHGWRKAETIEACYTALERFLRANIGPR